MALLLVSVAFGLVEGEELQRRIDEIARVHTSRPWPESQRMIEQLKPQLDQASLEQRVRVELMEARNHLLAGRHDEALALLDRVLGRPIAPDQRLRALELAANASGLVERYEDAFEYLASALALLPETDNARRKAAVYSLSARMYADAGETGRAQDFAARALDHAQRAGDPRAVCNARFTLLAVQKESGLVERAVQGIDALWRDCQQTGDPVVAGTSMGLIGWLLRAAGRPEEAIGWLERAIEACRQAGFRIGVLESRHTLGQALIDTGEIERGLAVLERVAGPFRELGRWRDLSEVHASIARAHELRGRYDQALAQLERARAAQQRFNEEGRARRLAYLQVEFENLEREQELRLLRQENRVLALREEAAEARRRTRRLGAGVLGVIAVLLVLLLYRFRADRRQFRRLYEFDGLTGLRNHRSFHQQAGSALAEAHAQGRVSVLVVADVDLFKQVNDRYGHRAGDAVLKSLGSALREHFPPPCILGRVGGEEFGIFLPGHNRLQARQRIQAFRDALGSITFGGKPIRVTLSFGLIEARGESRLESLRVDADNALYRAKRSGRDEVVDAADLATA